MVKKVPRRLEDELAAQKYNSHRRSSIPPRLAEGKDAHTEERHLLQEILGRPPKVGMLAGPPVVPPQKGPSQEFAGGAGSRADGDLLGAMAARLAKLESAHRRLRDELVSRDKEMLRLKRRSHALEAAAAAQDGVAEMAEQLEEMEGRNVRLHGQIRAMEKFLADYGLVWVGTEGGSQGDGVGDSRSESIQAKEGAAAEGEAAAPDLTQLLARLRELNELAGADQAKVVKGGGGNAARFDFDDRIPLAVYANGIMIRRGPFRVFGSPSATSFCRDVLDGFFPLEFKDQYPDGVGFDVTDRRRERYVQAFAGAGAALGSAARASNKVKSLADVGKAQLNMDKAEFLSRLPRHVVRNGRVVAVRDDIAGLMTTDNSLAAEESGAGDGSVRAAREAAAAAAEQRACAAAEDGGGTAAAVGDEDDDDESGAVVVIETPALLRSLRLSERFTATTGGGSEGEQDSKQDQQGKTGKKKEEEEGGDDDEIATLQVRSSNGQQSVVIKLGFRQTIRQLRQHLDSHRTDDSEYEIRTAFPNRAYEDEMTLLEAGLVPNATLFMRRVVVVDEKDTGGSE